MLQEHGGQEGVPGGDLAQPGVERRGGQHRPARQDHEDQNTGTALLLPHPVAGLAQQLHLKGSTSAY